MKPSIPKGTRDFSPETMVKRDYIFNTIKEVYKLYGFQPIETPAMEKLDTLLGKYGEEGDKLLFKVLNSGDFLSKVHGDTLNEKNSAKITTKISEKGLRYDLTVPFARYVVQNRNEITFPFKRYQIQPVWRADRPQKGRYREFYQCDADVIGSNSLLCEVELVQIIDEVFSRLGIATEILINNRKILAGIVEYIGFPDMMIDITVAIDKLDKIGLEKVNEELLARGLPKEAIEKLQPVIMLQGSVSEKITTLRDVLKDSEIGLKGVDEMEYVFNFLETCDIAADVNLDLTLARGLNYYTGAIFEVKAKNTSMGSICGGGRYDDLTGIFGLKDVSGVGISFGADRIYDVMEEEKMFPENVVASTKIMFVNFGAKEEQYCHQKVNMLRKEGVSSELYPDAAKMKKQMTYANKKGIRFVALVGENEMQEDKINLKNMETGEQSLVSFEELVSKIK
ncbi:MAG: histidine--tRNA ligase [Bacteroidota bacterium]|nr:histidine--tRNA ligase [Bacteroidota bacterium]